MKITYLTIAIALTILLVGCEKTPINTTAAPPDAATAEPTATAEATAAPTAEATAEPTATAEATAEPTAAPTAAPEAK